MNNSDALELIEGIRSWRRTFLALRLQKTCVDVLQFANAFKYKLTDFISFQEMLWLIQTYWIFDFDYFSFMKFGRSLSPRQPIINYNTSKFFCMVVDVYLVYKCVALDWDIILFLLRYFISTDHLLSTLPSWLKYVLGEKIRNQKLDFVRL